MRTQWRVGGMGYPSGFDYQAMPFVMRMAGVKPEEESAVFEDVRAMEIEALITMRKDEK